MRVDTSNNEFNKEAVVGGEDTESPLHIFLGSVNCGWIVDCEVAGWLCNGVAVVMVEGLRQDPLSSV